MEINCNLTNTVIKNFKKYFYIIKGNRRHLFRNHLRHFNVTTQNITYSEKGEHPFTSYKYKHQQEYDFQLYKCHK